MSQPIQVPSLIQGISQQSEITRPGSSASDQQNCVNDTTLGSRARNGTKLIKHYTGSISGSFTHRIQRSEEEDYLVIITPAEDMIVINLYDGTECTVTGDISAYLAHLGTTKDTFIAATVEDTTFIGNKEVVPAMDATTSTARAKVGIAHFKSANYSTDYYLHVKVNGTTYSVNYKTPDNSASANADYIATNKLAATFLASINSTLIPALNSAGKTGFSAVRNGSAIKITSTTYNFTLSTEDGLGGQQFIAFTDQVDGITQLPKYSWDGYQVAVVSSSEGNALKYYLQYDGDEQNGEWVEIVAPGTEYALDADTMPQALVNTDVNTFTVGNATWGDRLSGDGDRTSKDPYFIGRYLVDLQFLDGRLGIFTEGTWSLSRALNAYSFFPDTAQTTLPSDPIHYLVANGKTTIVKSSVVVGQKLQLWANGIQMVIDSADGALKEETAENPPITTYEYDGKVRPLAVGLSSLVFAQKRGPFNTVTEVYYKGAQADGEIVISAHVPRLLQGTMLDMSAGSSARFLYALTDWDPNRVWVYQWYNQGNERLQSAWNYWTFEAADEVVWIEMYGSTAIMLLQWDGVWTLEKLETEYEGDESGEIPLRADHRINEVGQTQETGYVTVTLPYPVAEAQQSLFTAYQRVDDDLTGEVRGTKMNMEWQSTTEVRVISNIDGVRFWVGAAPEARREMNRPYLTDSNGQTTLTGPIFINRFTVACNKSTAFDVEWTMRNSGEVKSEGYTARHNGNYDVVNNRMARMESDQLTVDIQAYAPEVSITLVNSDIYPSCWENARYDVRVEGRTRP